MLKLKREVADTNLEKRIITGLIVSKKYLQEVYPYLNLAYLRNDFTRRIATWAISFYEYYEEAPFTHIQDIYNKESVNLKEEETELIKQLLLDISKRYEYEKGLNVPYLVDETVEFCKQRELEIRAGNIQSLLERGDVKGAEDQISQFRKVQKITSKWVNPFEESEVLKTFSEMEDPLMTFPGQLGEFLGPFRREWLVGISAPFKRGKTWAALDFCIMGMMQDLNVVFISLEMNDVQMKDRFYKRMTAAASEGEGYYLYPCFDCYKNQDGSCLLPQRTSHIRLLNDNFEKPRFNRDSNYKPCTACRALRNGEYERATWFTELQRPEYTTQLVSKKMGDFYDILGTRFRMKSYPRFSANIADIRRDLDLLQNLEDVVPDLIVIDYADILKPETEGLSGVEKEDRSWIACAQLASTQKALVVVPTQLTKEALEAEKIRTRHTARWVGKLGHVDSMIALNQTEVEKEAGIMRVSILVHRHQDFHESDSCTILQLLELGQTNLDSQR